MKSFKLLFFVFLLQLQSCNAQNKKINGLSFVASPNAISKKHIDPVESVNANYCAIMPFGFIRNTEHPEIIFNTEEQWYGETKAGAKQYINALQKRGIKTMLKPQIWVWHGDYTGYIKMNSEATWKKLEESYTKFILEFAALAAQENVELFCIGTELESFIKERPEYWKQLINKIKTIYKGKLTYAANWDEFKRTPFWDALDFIGVDAYFPVSDSKTPTVKQCLDGWVKHKSVIKKIADTYKKPVLFTEFGYRSTDYTGKEPWVSDRKIGVVNLEGQANATQALFETFWNEEWFAGGFIWKWFINHDDVGGEENHMFTPQNKPVEALLHNYYKTYK